MDHLAIGAPMNCPMECPSCGSNSVSSAPEIDRFQYGDKENAVTLTVTICVHHCASCGCSFTADDASEIRHEAVCRHFGVLTPREVRGVRERYSLSQAEFSDLSKIGKASLARWECGALIQNQANDSLLFLLMFSENVGRLRNRAKANDKNRCNDCANIIPFKPRFRAILDSEVERLERDAKHFELFPAAM